MEDTYFVQSNSSLQSDEIKAMSSIYEKDWKELNSSHGIFTIAIRSKSSRCLHLQITLPQSYPLYSSPKYHFHASWINDSIRNMLSYELQRICSNHIGESVLYLMVEKVQEILQNLEDRKAEGVGQSFSKTKKLSKKRALADCQESEEEELKIEHGNVIVDRKSIFQGHLCVVKSVEQVDKVLLKLKEKKKISSAKHNIVVYRIYNEKKGVLLQDFDEDGEHKAGPSLLHLLQMVNVENVVIIVTRWYGGIHLGPDRFKHINGAARSVLAKCGYIDQQNVALKNTT